MENKGEACSICPRRCNTVRNMKKGFCGMGDSPVLAKAYLHMWEEPCISGTRGSGTVFFSGCNLKCVYCQNYKISRENFGKEITIDKLAGIYQSLEREGAHNINLVTPAHFIVPIRVSLEKASLKIPVVYNSNGYESVDGLRYISDHIDVYLPDIKYFTPEISLRYSNAHDYFVTAAAAVKEMYRQVGDPVFDDEGIIRKGLIIRHLILPGLTGESLKILEWIRENLSEKVYISLMSQYTPCYRAAEHPEINRRITRREYEKVLDYLFKLGFENGYVQERDSATLEYIPDFNLEGV